MKRKLVTTGFEPRSLHESVRLGEPDLSEPSYEVAEAGYLIRRQATDILFPGLMGGSAVLFNQWLARPMAKYGTEAHSWDHQTFWIPLWLTQQAD
jgi:hypothetical protein